MGTVSYIAWKQEVLVLGDLDGNVNFWDLKGKVSRYLTFFSINISLTWSISFLFASLIVQKLYLFTKVPKHLHTYL